MSIPLWLPIAVEGLKFGASMFSKPKRRSANTGYLDHMINNLRSDVANQQYYQTLLRSTTAGIGNNMAEANRNLLGKNKQTGMTGSGMETQGVLSLTSEGNQTISDANVKATEMEIGRVGNLKNRIMDAQTMKEQIKEQIRQQNEQADSQWKSNMIQQGLSSAVNIGGAIATNVMTEKATEQAFKTAMETGSLPKTVTNIAQYKDYIKNFGEGANTVLGVQKAKQTLSGLPEPIRKHPEVNNILSQVSQGIISASEGVTQLTDFLSKGVPVTRVEKDINGNPVENTYNLFANGNEVLAGSKPHKGTFKSATITNEKDQTKDVYEIPEDGGKPVKIASFEQEQPVKIVEIRNGRKYTYDQYKDKKVLISNEVAPKESGDGSGTGKSIKRYNYLGTTPEKWTSEDYGNLVLDMQKKEGTQDSYKVNLASVPTRDANGNIITYTKNVKYSSGKTVSTKTNQQQMTGSKEISIHPRYDTNGKIIGFSYDNSQNTPVPLAVIKRFMLKNPLSGDEIEDLMSIVNKIKP
jgi:hypothetical protein